MRASSPGSLWLAALLATLLAALLAGCQDAGTGATRQPPTEDIAAAYVGSAACGSCHEAELDLWQGSHHDLALQPASASTVLADFDDAEFFLDGVTTRFFRRDGDYLVATEGADGAVGEFRVVHAFGIDPLQQYLVEYERGRLQALSVAWDTRPVEQGGQRWFHLYGDDPPPAGDPLHWTSVLQNWNTMCADCHSTAVAKGFDVETDSYATTFAEEDVGCEACHGPGSRHAAAPADVSLTHAIVPRAWVLAPGAAIASRSGAEPAMRETDTCARCHSRRAQLDDAGPPAPLTAHYRPERLGRGPYFDDGQVREEVYVWASFLQSRMHSAGVTCSDCHEPHALTLRASGDELCATCHSPDVFAAETHHRHPVAAGSRSAVQGAGSQARADPSAVDAAGGPASAGVPRCVDCHMRAETFMQVDPRRDHSFRVPRPDLSVGIDSPNACNDCHRDESAAWAAARIAEWFPQGRQTEAHFGAAFAAVRNWQDDAADALLPLVTDGEQPAIVRATALSLLGAGINAVDTATLNALAGDASDEVRLALIDAAVQLPPARRADVVQRFLSDAPLALRQAATQTLLTARDTLGAGRRADLDAGIEEALAVARFGADRPEGLTAAAQIEVLRGDPEAARGWLQLAVERFPWFVPAYVNLADLERASGRNDAALAIVERGLAATPDATALQIARALALVRLERRDEALAVLSEVYAAEPDEPYHAYLLGLAMQSTGRTMEAVGVLEAAGARAPAYAELWYALATIARDEGRRDDAREFAQRGRDNVPGDPRFSALLTELELP